MTRLVIAALMLAATPAAAHDHWSDLDGDGLLEPNEFGLESMPIEAVDINKDGIISVAEYQALVLLRADDVEAIVPEASISGETGLGADDVPARFEPKFIRVGQ